MTIAASDFGDQFPSASITGTDLSPIQPRWTPPNVNFEINDCCDEWIFRRESFDFIHIRSLYGCVADWPEFFRQAMRLVIKHLFGTLLADHTLFFSCLKPGGYVEQVEMSVIPKSDDGTTDGTIFEQWGKVSVEAGEKFGKSLQLVDESADNMRKAGFEDVVEKRFKVPIGSWAKDSRLKELGKWNWIHWSEGIEGWCMMLLTSILGVHFSLPFSLSCYSRSLTKIILHSGSLMKSMYTWPKCEKD